MVKDEMGHFALCSIKLVAQMEIKLGMRNRKTQMGEIEFRKVDIPEEIQALCDFDRIAFRDYPADIFDPEEWSRYECYWMILDGRIVGCTALQHQSEELWITSTAILPEFRKQGLGKKLKKWQIDFAKANGFSRIATRMRESNEAILSLNEKFGFRRREARPHEYSDPDETGIVMELRLPLPNCPKCDRQLSTHRAKRCRFCGADWH